MIPASRIFAIADACLDAVVAHYIAAGVSLPARQYVANGLPSFDCEQITVFVENTYGIQGSPLAENPAAQLRDAGHAMRAAVFAITIVRCVPVLDDEGDPPSPADESASAAEIYADATLCLNALVAAEVAGGLPGCGSVAFLQWRNENAQGGLGGGTLRVAVSLSDAF